jgi:hypothetical protein
MEELRQQLGERLPVAFEATARGLGITQQELNDLVSSGDLTAREFFPAFAEGLRSIGGEVPPLIQALGEIGNVVDAVGREFGQSLLPIQESLAVLGADVLSGLDFEDIFSPLQESAEDFSAALDGNQEVIDRITESLQVFGENSVAALANVIDSISAFISDAERVDQVAQQFDAFANAVVALGNVASVFVDLSSASADLLARIERIPVVGEAIRDSFTSLTPQFTLTLGLVRELRDALAFTRDLKSANDELDAIGNATNVATGGAIARAQTLESAINEVTAAIARGNTATEAEANRVAQTLKIAQDELAALQQQRQDVLSAEPQNDAQRSTQQALLAEIQVTERALQGQISAAESALKDIESAAQNTAKALSEVLPNVVSSAKDVFERFNAEQESSLTELLQAREGYISQVDRLEQNGVISAKEAADARVEIEKSANDQIEEARKESLDAFERAINNTISAIWRAASSSPMVPAACCWRTALIRDCAP